MISRMKMFILAALAAASSAPAPAETVTPVAPVRDAAWHNAQFLYLLNLKPADGWRSTASGLRYRRVKAGAAGAPHPSPTDTVTIHYEGRFIHGAQFDSSIGRGEPATFPLPRLIPGWQEGVPLMAVGVGTTSLAVFRQRSAFRSAFIHGTRTPSGRSL